MTSEGRGGHTGGGKKAKTRKKRNPERLGKTQPRTIHELGVGSRKISGRGKEKIPCYREGRKAQMRDQWA